MKNILTVVSACMVVILFSTGISAQGTTKIKVKGDHVYINNEHSFDIIMVGFAQEIIIKTKEGSIMYNLMQMRVAVGYRSSSGVDSRGNYSSSSGTIYTNYYTMRDTNGNACEIGYAGLQNKRDVAKYVLANNLVKNGTADLDAFISFCHMHGNAFSSGTGGQ